MSSVDICDVTVELAQRQIISGIRLVAAAGEIAGIVGPNGAGKSTLLRTIYRFLAPKAGVVRIDDDVVGSLPGRVLAQRVAVVPQAEAVPFDLTVREAVALGRLPHQGGFARASAADRRIVANALAQAELTELADRFCSTLSGGEAQRVALARAFAQAVPDGQVLVLDEPTNHLDVAHQVQLLRLIRAQQMTTVITMHDLSLAAALCDRLHVVHQGRLVASGTPVEVLTSELLAEVFGVVGQVLTNPLTRTPLLAIDTR